MVGKHLGDGGAGGLTIGEGSLRKWSAKNEEIRCDFPGKERTSQGQRQCGSWRPGARISVVGGGEREERSKGCGAVRSQSPWWRQSALSNLFISKDTTEFDRCERSSPCFYTIALGLDSIAGNLFKINPDTREWQTRCPPREHSSTERRWRFLPSGQWHRSHPASPWAPSKGAASWLHRLHNLEQAIFPPFPTEMRSHFHGEL